MWKGKKHFLQIWFRIKEIRFQLLNFTLTLWRPDLMVLSWYTDEDAYIFVYQDFTASEKGFIAFFYHCFR